MFPRNLNLRIINFKELPTLISTLPFFVWLVPVISFSESGSSESTIPLPASENAHRTGSFDLLRQAIAFRRDLQGGRWPDVRQRHTQVSGITCDVTQDPEAGGASQAAGETFDANSCTGARVEYSSVTGNWGCH